MESIMQVSANIQLLAGVSEKAHFSIVTIFLGIFNSLYEFLTFETTVQNIVLWQIRIKLLQIDNLR